MKYKLLVVSSLTAAIGSAVVLGGCEWRPFGRDYFVSGGDGKAGSTYGEPWINSVTYGTVNKDTPHDAKAGGDIYLAANFDRIISTELTEGQRSAGVSEEAFKEVSSCLLDIMKTPGNSVAAKQVNSLYTLYTDTEGRKNAWKEDILPLIKPLQDANNLDELTAYLCSDSYFNNGESIVSFDLDLDYEDPDFYSFVIIPTSLSLGDAAEYANKSDYGKKTEEVFTKQATLLLEKAGYSDEGAKTIISAALAFEGDIASHMKTQEFKYSSDYIASVNNPVTTAHIEGTQGSFPLSEILKAYGIADSKRLYMIEPDWLAGMSTLYNEDNFENVKSYLIIKTLQGYADSADEDTYTGMRDIYNEAHEIKSEETLEDRAFSYVKSMLPGALGRLYADSYVKQNEKETAGKLAYDIRIKMKSIASELSFLSEASRAEAEAKLDNMKIHISDTESSPAVTDADLKSKSSGGSLALAAASIREADRKEKLSHLDKKVSDDEFNTDITDVNVRYFGLGNSLMINAGALTEYNKNAGIREELLGGLGTLIAREMAGAILKTGSSYDSKGRYAPYWTEEDKKGYEAEFKALKDELDAVKPFKNDTKLNGARVLDSVVNELFGFKALKAIATEEGLDTDKLISAFAKSRFTIMREEVMEDKGLNSSEALPYIVINTVTNK